MSGELASHIECSASIAVCWMVLSFSIFGRCVEIPPPPSLEARPFPCHCYCLPVCSIVQCESFVHTENKTHLHYIYICNIHSLSYPVPCVYNLTQQTNILLDYSSLAQGIASIHSTTNLAPV